MKTTYRTESLQRASQTYIKHITHTLTPFLISDTQNSDHVKIRYGIYGCIPTAEEYGCQSCLRELNTVVLSTFSQFIMRFDFKIVLYTQQRTVADLIMMTNLKSELTTLFQKKKKGPTERKCTKILVTENLEQRCEYWQGLSSIS